MKPTILAMTLITLVASILCAQAPPFDFYAQGPYQQGLPRPDDVLGYAIGARHSYHYQMVEYMRALEQATPRVRMVEYGTSTEGRKLYLVLISSEENITRLGEIRAVMARLADPRTINGEAELRNLVQGTPAIAWLNFANDGNESAAFETGMQIAYQLAASENPAVQKIRSEVVTIVDPAHNPESHERFVTWYRAVKTPMEGNPDPNALEHNRDWLMDSNDNHYHVDPNRDAFRLSQQESQAVVAQIHRWHPQVFIDHHGNPPIFFFPPVAKPINENFPQSSRKWETTFGRAIGSAFDQYSWSYMNRETFDLHYPGYFDSYPSLNGAIGMTFETDGGGSQGLQLERPDGTRSTLRGAIAKHFTGSMAVLTAVSSDKQTLLTDYYNFRKSGMDEAARGPARQYVLLEGRDPARAASLVDLLRRHQIEVHRATRPFSSRTVHNYFTDAVETREFPAGTYVIPAAQPQKRLLTALLEKEATLNADFLERIREIKAANETLGERAGKERFGFYDMTAWNLALSYGVEAYWTEDTAASLEPVTEAPALPKGVFGGPARFGYLYKPENNNTLSLTASLFREGFKLVVSSTTITVGEESFPPGSILLRVERNPETLRERIAALAQETGTRVWAVNSAWTEAGPSLGSRHLTDLKAPKVVVAAYEPVNGRAYGHAWFYLEKLLGYPFTPIKVEDLGSTDLSEYDVLIFPDGRDSGYEQRLGKRGVDNIKSWIQNGGVFIGFKGGAAFASRVGWTSSHLHGRPLPEEAKKKLGKEEVRKIEADVLSTPGAMLRTKLTTAHFLNYGYGDEATVLQNSGYIFTKSEEGTNVATYLEQDAHVTGFIWDETRDRLAGTSYLIDENVGRGHVILFADDPLFRFLWPSLERFVANSIFLAPSLR